MKKNETNQPKRKPGGQPGNQNARTHGFYSRRRLSAEEHHALEAAAGVSGLDYEIALLRAKILSILANDPDNMSVLCLALSALVQAVKARHQLETESPGGLAEAVKNMLAELSLPPGLAGASDIIAPPDVPPREEITKGGGGEGESRPGREA
jgi:hypothetical protein